MKSRGTYLGDGVWWGTSSPCRGRELQADLPPAFSMPLHLDFHLIWMEVRCLLLLLPPPPGLSVVCLSVTGPSTPLPMAQELPDSPATSLTSSSPVASTSLQSDRLCHKLSHFSSILLRVDVFSLKIIYSPIIVFSSGSDSRESACNAGDPGTIPGLGRCPGEGNGYPLQYSCLENSMERGAWWATVHGVAKSRT